MPDQLTIDRIRKVTLEFTTRCNLKCVYCAVTRPWHQKMDLDVSDFDALVAQLKQLGVEVVQISGGGETTILKGWDDYLYKLLDNGFLVTIISNMAKPMTERAARALSRCAEITTSCDTVDPELFEAIRNGGDARLFFHNILRVRALAIADSRIPPRFIWNCVANDHVIFRVREWVSMGIALGVAHFQISDMTQFPDLPAQLNVRPIGVLSLEELRRARAVVDEARRIAEQAGKAFTVLPLVEEVLQGQRKVVITNPKVERDATGKETLVGQRRLVQILGAGDGVHIEESKPAPPVPPGLTRNCLLPWTEAIVWARTGVGPCCLYHGFAPFSGAGFANSLNTDGFVKLRRELLDGRLSEICQACPMAELVETRILQDRVANLVAAAAASTEPRP